MSQSNKASSDGRILIEEEIQTTREALMTLREEIKESMEMYIRRAPNNAIWDARVHAMECQLRTNLSRIHCLKLALNYWAKRHLKIVHRTIPN
jgi:hypothetical protein